MTVNQTGISTDKLNEKMLKAADVLKPLGISILANEENYGVLEGRPLGMVIKSLDVRFLFSEVSE